MVPQLLQALLDSTPLPKDVLEHLILPELLPSKDIVRSMFKLVVRQLNKLGDYTCAHCAKFSVSVASTDPTNRFQPFNVARNPESYVPFCQKCVQTHRNRFSTWNRKTPKARRNHMFQNWNPNRTAHDVGQLMYHIQQQPGGLLGFALNHHEIAIHGEQGNGIFAGIGLGIGQLAHALFA